jgi:hypothetical protein
MFPFGRYFTDIASSMSILPNGSILNILSFLISLLLEISSVGTFQLVSGIPATKDN